MRGVIYSAVGENFVAEAINSARSSLRFNHMPHVIFCDPTPRAVAGIELRHIRSSGDHFEDKINTIRSTPFTETLFLDTDTFVVAALDDLFHVLKRFDMALAYEALYTTSGDQVPPDAFAELSSGVIAYRNSKEVAETLDAWLQLYRLWRHTPPVPFYVQGEKRDPERRFRRGAVEQHALRRALWEHNVSVWVLGPEYNFRPIDVSRLCGRLKIIHGRVNFEQVAEFAHKHLGPRTFKFNPPPDFKFP